MQKALWTVSGTGKHACTAGDVTGVVVITIVVTATAQPQVQVLEDRTEHGSLSHDIGRSCLLVRMYFFLALILAQTTWLCKRR